MIIRTVAAIGCAGMLFWALGQGSIEGHSPGDAGSAQVVPAWYDAARTAPATPVQLSRVLAMVHAAMHDAVNGAEPRYETYASDLTDRRAHPEAAAAAAAHRVLTGLFPVQQERWIRLSRIRCQRSPMGRAGRPASGWAPRSAGSSLRFVRTMDGTRSIPSIRPRFPASGDQRRLLSVQWPSRSFTTSGHSRSSAAISSRCLHLRHLATWITSVCSKK